MLKYIHFKIEYNIRSQALCSSTYLANTTCISMNDLAMHAAKFGFLIVITVVYTKENITCNGQQYYKLQFT